MAYNYEYPYTDPNRYNSDWLLNRVKELDEEVTKFSDEVLAKAKEYTDEQIRARLAEVEQDFAQFKIDVNNALEQYDSKFDLFTQEINARLIVTEGKFAELTRRVDSVLRESNEYTNYAILQNNEYIINQTTQALGGVTVLNYFTGERVSIQEMFDYLANFHLNNAITYDEIADKDLTYNQIIALNATYTDLAINGKTIIN